MQRASDLFTDEQKQRISRAVAEAESKTSAEIVPVVATASGRYDRPEDIVGLWTAVLVMVILWPLLPGSASQPGSWGGMSSAGQLLVLVAGVVVGFLIGAVLGCRIGWLRRLFTPRRQMCEEIQQRSREVFFDKRVHHTEGGAGLLVYVSLFERMAVILADQTILEKLGQPTIDDLCRRLTGTLRESDVTEALCTIIEEAGNQLASVLPRSAADVNELSDALITLD